MQEEIFGPILPVMAYETLDEAIAYVNAVPARSPCTCSPRTRPRRGRARRDNLRRRA